MVRKSASGRTLLENTYDLNGNRVGLKDYSGKETVYTYDALDRISKVTDNGHELIDYLYNDDGTLKEEQVANRFGFTGEQFAPATNLYYLRARFYNPIIGRFNQGYRELIEAGVSEKDAKKAMRRAYKYFDSIGAFKVK